MKQKLQDTHLGRVLDCLPLGACRIDAQWNLLNINPTFPGITFSAEQPYLGKGLEDAIAPYFYKLFKPHIESAMLGAYVAIDSIKCEVSQQGRMMDASFFPSRDETGEIDGVVILVNDVTDKAALDATQKELMDYLAALDAHAIVAVTDVHGVITFVNEKFCEISQYSRSELYGKTHRVGPVHNFV